MMVTYLLLWGETMKKILKYIGPFIFSACFFLSYLILSTVLNAVLERGSYAGLFYGIIFLVVTVVVAVPVYCRIYCRIIKNEPKRNFFVFYNTFIFTILFMLFGFSETEMFIYAVILGAWVMLWTAAPANNSEQQ